MHNKLKISHRRHSGRLLPHEYTSYIPLAVLLVVVGVLLTVSSVYAGDPPPQASSVSLTGEMPAPPPQTGATITSPSASQHFGTSPVTVSGTCPSNTLVEIYKNDIFAGSAPCTGSGTFSFDVDLLIGQNILIARVYDALNQPGPDSAPVTTYYDALPAQGSPLAALSFGGSQLILNTDAVYRGTFPGQALTMPIDIMGGTPPYAVNILWGDTTNKIVPRNNDVTFDVSHTYMKAGVYQIILQGSDSAGRIAYLTVAAIVNGQPGAVTSTTTKTPGTNPLLALWPLYTIAATMLISFWLGEVREKRILANPTPTLSLHAQR